MSQDALDRTRSFHTFSRKQKQEYALKMKYAEERKALSNPAEVDRCHRQMEEIRKKQLKEALERRKM